MVFNRRIAASLIELLSVFLGEFFLHSIIGVSFVCVSSERAPTHHTEEMEVPRLFWFAHRIGLQTTGAPDAGFKR